MQPDATDYLERRRQNDEERKDAIEEYREEAETALLAGSSFDGVDVDRVAEGILLTDDLGFLMLEAERTGNWGAISKIVRDAVEHEIDCGERQMFKERAA